MSDKPLAAHIDETNQHLAIVGNTESERSAESKKRQEEADIVKLYFPEIVNEAIQATRETTDRYQAAIEAGMTAKFQLDKVKNGLAQLGIKPTPGQQKNIAACEEKLGEGKESIEAEQAMHAAVKDFIDNSPSVAKLNLSDEQKKSLTGQAILEIQNAAMARAETTLIDSKEAAETDLAGGMIGHVMKRLGVTPAAPVIDTDLLKGANNVANPTRAVLPFDKNSLATTVAMGR